LATINLIPAHTKAGLSQGCRSSEAHSFPLRGGIQPSRELLDSDAAFLHFLQTFREFAEAIQVEG